MASYSQTPDRAGATYLLRFDDLCPTMDKARWERLLPLLRQYSIRPILAIVPDNQDPFLDRNSADPTFWNHMRELQSFGATIGLHGLGHVCTATGRSLVPLHRHTEFAGSPEIVQRSRIQRGLKILQGQALQARIWVAPRHGFDKTTLKILQEEKLFLISDGLGARAVRRGGLTWIPQQLWAPVDKDSGLWTIAYHPNTASDAQITQLEQFLARRHTQFSCVPEVIENCALPRYAPKDWIQEQWMLFRKRFSRIRRKLTFYNPAEPIATVVPAHAVTLDKDSPTDRE